MARKFFQRPQGSKERRVQIHAVVEGKKTEWSYIVNVLKQKIYSNMSCHYKDANDAEGLIKTVKNIKQDAKTYPDDIFWIICDLDDKNAQQKQELEQWQKENPDRHYLALSDPCFEVWLLLHFQDYGFPDDLCKDITSKLKQYIKDYDKIIPNNKIQEGGIIKAYQGAIKQIQDNKEKSRTRPQTTMHELIHFIYTKLGRENELQK